MEKVKFVDSSINASIAELLSKLDHRTLVLWATDCAEHVLPYFEEKFSKDNRPRKAIEAGRAWVRGEITMGEACIAAFAAHAAARDTNQSADWDNQSADWDNQVAVNQAAACAAARAAGHAAATAHVTGHAVHSATYAAKATAFVSDLNNADTNTAKERNWQYQHLLDLENNH